MTLFDRFLDHLNARAISFPEQALTLLISEHILGIEKWEWDYEDCHRFQEAALEFVAANAKDRIYIFCNHPRVFTLGSGLQKKQGQTLPGLVDFHEGQRHLLDFPLHKIRRGGGITFHHPGQWIFYPIINLNDPNWGLSKHFDWLLQSVSEVLRQRFQLHNVEPRKDTAGIWVGQHKIASIGVGVKRFVTFHGLALNIFTDEKMLMNLNRINPCGLNPTTYRALDKWVLESEQNLLHRFHQKFIANIS